MIYTENAVLKEWILKQERKDGKYHEHKYGEKGRLILGYSEDRARKDVHNREKGVQRLRKAYASGKITKASVNLEARPIFHFTEKRIEAHICICFIAYKVYKELERIIKLGKMKISVDAALKIAKTVATIRINMPNNGKAIQQTLLLTPAQLSIKRLFNIESILNEGKSY